MFKFIYYLIFNKNNKTINSTIDTIDGFKTWNSYMAILWLSILSIVDTIDGFGYRWWLFFFGFRTLLFSNIFQYYIW